MPCKSAIAVLLALVKMKECKAGWWVESHSEDWFSFRNAAQNDATLVKEKRALRAEASVPWLRGGGGHSFSK